VDSYGLSVTTLEEVFLRVSESAAAASAAAAAVAASAAPIAAGSAPATEALEEQQWEQRHKEPEVANGTADGTAAADVDRSEFVVVNLPRRYYLKVTAGIYRAGTAAPAGHTCLRCCPQ
jgi:hypothetical protein